MARTSKPNAPAPVEAHPSDDFQLMAQHAGGYCGQALKEAREKQGLSIENIAGRLRLSVRQINAIETDNLAQLPQASTVRGFIRNYAKELKIDPAPLIEAFNRISPDKAPQALTLEPSTHMTISSSEPSKLPSLMWIGFALIAGLGIWWAMQYFGAKTPTTTPEVTESAIAESAVVSEIVAPTVLPATEPTLTVPIDINTPPPTEPVTAASTNNTIVTPNASLPNAASPNTPLTESAVPNNPVTRAPSALPDATNNTRLDKKLGDATASPVSANPSPANLTLLPAEVPAEPVKAINTGKANLSISTTEETWVNIVNANGKEIYSKLLSAGTSEEIAISKPLSITIGNATGATLTVNGAPMTLNTRAGSKVARVKLK